MIGSIASWRTYATARGNAAPAAASDADATAALTRASDYILYHYVNQFLPGYDVTSDYVEEATYEAAGFELTTPNFFTASYTPDQVKVLTEVKGIKWTVREPRAGLEGWQQATPVVTKIEAMLSDYMESSARIGIISIGPL